MVMICGGAFRASILKPFSSINVSRFLNLLEMGERRGRGRRVLNSNLALGAEIQFKASLTDGSPASTFNSSPNITRVT